MGLDNKIAPFPCKRKDIGRLVQAYDLTLGHHDKRGALLFDCYDAGGNPVIKLSNGNTHTAFNAESFMIDEPTGKYFITKKAFSLNYERVQKARDVTRPYNVPVLYKSKDITKYAFDLSEGHYDLDGNLIFDSYDKESNPILRTLESKGYIGSPDGFVIVGVIGEKHFCSRKNFEKLYHRLEVPENHVIRKEGDGFETMKLNQPTVDAINVPRDEYTKYKKG